MSLFSQPKKKATLIKGEYRCPPLILKVIRKKISYFLRSFNLYYPLAANQETLRCQPLFIIGSGRSGTTLMLSMLVAGGQIAIPVETQILHILPAKFLAYQGLDWGDLSKLIVSEFESRWNFKFWNTNLAPVYNRVQNLPHPQRSLANIIDEVYKSYASENFPEAKHWGDQSPINTFYLPYILKTFPQAKFLHMLRDGRDVVSAILEHKGNEHIMQAINRWKSSLKSVKNIKKQLSPDQFLELRYEDLVTDPQEALRHVCHHIGISYNPSTLDYWKLPSTIEHKFLTKRHKDLAKPLFTEGIGIWQTNLSTEQQEFVIKNIHKELFESGYL